MERHTGVTRSLGCREMERHTGVNRSSGCREMERHTGVNMSSAYKKRRRKRRRNHLTRHAMYLNHYIRFHLEIENVTQMTVAPAH
jgi:hypothetical protein